MNIFAFTFLLLLSFTLASAKIEEMTLEDILVTDVKDGGMNLRSSNSETSEEGS